MMPALAMWRAAFVSLCIPTLLVSAGPEGYYPDPEGLNACRNESNVMYNETWYLFNKDGRPRPADLKVARHYDGVPNDLTSLAIMRALVENNPDDIKTLLPFNDSTVTNDHWKAVCSGKRRDYITPMVNFLGPPDTFMAFNMSTAYDAELGSMWPIVIQTRLNRVTGAFGQGFSGPLAGIQRQAKGNCFVACLSHTLDVAAYAAPMANVFWNDGLHRPGNFVTEPIPRREDGTINYLEIDKFINRTISSVAPTLLISKNETQGHVIHPGTIYTLGKHPEMPIGGLRARDVRLQPGDPGQEVRISAQEITADGAFLTYLKW